MVLEEKTISSDRVYTGKVITLKVDTVEIPGQGYQKRELVEVGGAVGIVAITDDNKVVLVKQFRKPIEKPIFEIPAGKLEKNESPKECAERELKEETGLDLLDVNNDYTIEKTYLSPGMTDESIALVFCTCDGELNKDGLEDDEDIEAILVSKEEARKILKSKEKMDVKAFLMLQNFVLLGEKMFI